MTDDDFLRAIADDRWNDGPRLLYADWLDERGDPRAQYLRLVHQAAERMRANEPWEDLAGELESLVQRIAAQLNRPAGLRYNVMLTTSPTRDQLAAIQRRMETRPLRKDELPFVGRALIHAEALLRQREIAAIPGCQASILSSSTVWHIAAGTPFDVMLISCEPSTKGAVIRELRAFLGLGHGGAVALVGAIPCALRSHVPLEQAIKWRERATAAFAASRSELAIRPAILGKQQ